MQDGEYLPQDPIDQFKCGRKIKKKKCEAGGTVNLDKCGAKMKKKKCEDGGIVNIDKCGAKIKKKKCENGGFIPFDKCGSKIKKKETGGPVKKFPLKENNGTKYYNDRATRDSVAVNKYGAEDISSTMPGSYKKNKQGKVQWTPDRSKSPYNTLKKK